MIRLVGFIVVISIVAGCSEKTTENDRAGKNERASTLRLAVSTTTTDSGLLDTLIPLFEKENGARAEVLAVGTGKALQLGEEGDIDVALVHSLTVELPFMGAGHGIRREEVMVNYFEILGPPDDPAGIRGLEPIPALQKIADGKHKFVSRGDDSGTHKRELTLWWAAGGRPDSQEYVESRMGTGQMLILADRLSAYVLADRGTYLQLKPKIKLVPLVARTNELRNPYAIIVVNPQKSPDINEQLAQNFVDFIISPTVQRMIADYQIEGEQLFQPLRLSEGNASSDAKGSPDDR